MVLIVTALLGLLTIATYMLSMQRAVASVDGALSELHSLPFYHGLFAGLVTLLVGFAVFIGAMIGFGIWMDSQLWAALPDVARELSLFERQQIIADGRTMADGGIVSRPMNEIVGQARQAVAETYGAVSAIRDWAVGILSVGAAAVAAALVYRRLDTRFRARNMAERVILGVLIASAAIAILTTIGIVLSLIGETLKFFSQVSVFKFLFGAHWNPLAGVFEGKINPDSVGAVPLFAGTFMITLIAMIVAVPIGLMSAIYLSDYASARTRSWAKPLLELLAGIPTVVYGFFAVITVAPLIRGSGEAIGLDVASESALAAGMVMGIMIIPFISSLSDDVINAVPQSLRDGSMGLGATKAETITRVVLPAALPGIVSAILLGVSRAVGETMIVVMAAGQSANLTANPLEAVTTVTVQIVALITGDTEADTAAGPAFALGFTLFCLTLAFNVLALRIVQKYRQKYD